MDLLIKLILILIFAVMYFIAIKKQISFLERLAVLTLIIFIFVYFLVAYFHNKNKNEEDTRVDIAKNIWVPNFTPMYSNLPEVDLQKLLSDRLDMKNRNNQYTIHYLANVYKDGYFGFQREQDENKITENIKRFMSYEDGKKLDTFLLKDSPHRDLFNAARRFTFIKLAILSYSGGVWIDTPQFLLSNESFKNIIEKTKGDILAYTTDNTYLKTNTGYPFVYTDILICNKNNELIKKMTEEYYDAILTGDTDTEIIKKFIDTGVYTKFSSLSKTYDNVYFDQLDSYANFVPEMLMQKLIISMEYKKIGSLGNIEDSSFKHISNYITDNELEQKYKNLIAGKNISEPENGNKNSLVLLDSDHYLKLELDLKGDKNILNNLFVN